MVAAFQFSSLFGRLAGGTIADRVGALNALIVGLFLNAVSMLAIWPVSTSIGPLAVFVILNGLANGAFFSTMPTVVSNVFGSARVAVAMGMVVTGWTAGYLLVSELPVLAMGVDLTFSPGRAHRWVHSRCYRQ